MSFFFMEKYMSLQLAIKFASALPIVRGQQRLCSVVSDKRGRVLSIGINSYNKSHPLQAKYAEQVGNPAACYLHSEVASLVALGYNDRLKAYKISVARVLKNGEVGLVAPCTACQNAIKEFNIKVVEYTI